VTDRHHKVQENINQMEEMNHYWFMGGGGGGVHNDIYPQIFKIITKTRKKTKV